MGEVSTYNTTLQLEAIKIKLPVEEIQILQDVLIGCKPFNGIEKGMNIVFSSIVKDVYKQVSTKVFHQQNNLKLKAHEALVLKQLLMQPNDYGVFESAIITKITHQIDQFYI